MRHKKLLKKTVSWRIISSAATLGLIFLFTGDINLAGTIGAVDFFLKTALYYAHERFWHKLHKE